MIPLEVKSGKDYKRYSALNQLRSNESFHMKEGIVLCHDNVSIMTESILSDLHEHVPSQTQGNTFRKD